MHNWKKTYNSFFLQYYSNWPAPMPLLKKKVMEILSHVNKRVKTNESIKLPFNSLLAQFTDSQVTTFVKNFTLIYLDMSASRQSSEEIAERLPELLKGISLRPVQQRIQLLHIILPVSVYIRNN